MPKVWQASCSSRWLIVHHCPCVFLTCKAARVFEHTPYFQVLHTFLKSSKYQKHFWGQEPLLSLLTNLHIGWPIVASGQPCQWQRLICPKIQRSMSLTNAKPARVAVCWEIMQQIIETFFGLLDVKERGAHCSPYLHTHSIPLSNACNHLIPLFYNSPLW